MANYNDLKTAIQDVIKANGNQEITGDIMQNALMSMINSLGAGYQFIGVATPETNPGTPDQKVFYVANGKGTYANFGGLIVDEDEVIILYYDTEWHKVSTGIASQAKLTELESEIGVEKDHTNSNLSNRVNEQRFRQLGSLYLADLVSGVSDGSKWQGLDLVFSHILPSAKIRMTGARNLGYGFLLRIREYLSEDGTGTFTETKTTEGELVITLKPTTRSIAATWAACWDAEAIPSGTPIELSNIRLEYVDVNYEKLNAKVTQIDSALSEIFDSYTYFDDKTTSGFTERINEYKYLTDNVIYRADSINGISNGSKWQGVDLSFSNIIQGATLKISGSRNTGYGLTHRLREYETDNASGSYVETKNYTEDALIVTLRPTTRSISVLWAACWDNDAITSETAIELSDLKLEYINEDVESVTEDVGSLLSAYTFFDDKTVASFTTRVNEHRFLTDTMIYFADSISGVSNGGVWQGVEFWYNNIIPGATLKMHCERNVGYGIRYRIRQYVTKDCSGAYTTTTSSDDSMVITLLSTTQSIAVLFVACWDSDAIPSGTAIELSNISLQYDTPEVIPGNSIYYGERFDININNKRNGCNISTWKHFESGDIETYSIQTSQSMAIYGGYVFLFSERSLVTVLDYSTKNVVAHFSFSQRTHSNSAQFIDDLYYQDGDDFPILALSRCNGTGNDNCDLFRVTHTGNSWAMEMVGTIAITGLSESYGMSWVYDSANRMLYSYMAFGTWQQVLPTNHTRLMGWKVDNLLTAESVAVQDAVINRKYRWITLQGATFFNGYIYLALQDYADSNKPHIWRINPYNGVVENDIKLIGNEVEGVSIYDNKIWYNSVVQSAQAEEPCDIYSIEIL